MKIAGGVSEDGIVIGNTYDKYGSKNPIVRAMMNGFDHALEDLVAKVNPVTIHEVGCGEGYWVIKWRHRGLDARGCDFSSQAIKIAQGNAIDRGLSSELFSVRSIYEMAEKQDQADLIVCCEVMEHLERPTEALRVLKQIVQDRHVIFSVPREPLWRLLNMARGKYVGALGNTPGHLQHWSRTGFVRLIGGYFDIVEVKSPLPWTMLLARGRSSLRVAPN